MKQMSVRAIVLICFCAVLAAGVLLFCCIYIADAESWALYPANYHIYTNGEITRAGKICDRNGIVLAETKDDKRIYNDDETIRRATLHAIGDPFGYISTGLHNAHRDLLVGYNIVNGVYRYGNEGNDITTTLDADVCKTALNALGDRKGTVGVYNYKTGEMICMVSNPTYDIEDEDECDKALSGEINGVYINRFLSAKYPPGSTFKLITAAAALDTFDDAYTRTYKCNHGVTIDGEDVTCMGYHGTISLKLALAKSCNAYFSQLAVDLGTEKLTEYARKFGFNGKFDIDGIETIPSFFDVSGARNIDLAWAGMGQYTNLMTPLQYLTAIGGIANGGVPIKPYIIDNAKNAQGISVKWGRTKSLSRMLSEDTANKLSDLMASNVEINYGRGNYPGLDLCAKSGTAEVGKDKIPNAVFVGFTRNEDMPLAFVVVIENGGAGSTYGGAVANKVLQKCLSKLT